MSGRSIENGMAAAANFRAARYDQNDQNMGYFPYLWGFPEQF